MNLADIFWAAVLIPMGLSFGIMLSYMFFGVDLTTLFRKSDDD